MGDETKFEFVPFKNEFSVDISESDLQTITESAGLKEEDATKLATTFESGVNAKVSEISEAMETHYKDQAETMLEDKSDELVSHISGFLEKVMNEWVEENAEAIDESIKVEVNSELVEGLVNLLKDSYFEIPADRKDIVESLASDVETLEEANTELEEQVATLTSVMKGKQCEDVVGSLAEGLTDTQAEKFVSLIEDFDIDDVDQFSKKAKIIREEFFKASASKDDDLDEGKTDLDDEEIDESKLSYGDRMIRSAAAKKANK